MRCAVELIGILVPWAHQSIHNFEFSAGKSSFQNNGIGSTCGLNACGQKQQ
jgi:hypothetical protein